MCRSDRVHEACLGLHALMSPQALEPILLRIEIEDSPDYHCAAAAFRDQTENALVLNFNRNFIQVPDDGNVIGDRPV